MEKSLIDEAISLTQANLEHVNITLGALKDFELDKYNKKTLKDWKIIYKYILTLLLKEKQKEEL